MDDETNREFSRVPTVENMGRVKQALSCLPDNAVHQIADDDVQKYT